MEQSDSQRVAEVLADVDLMRITDGNPDPVGEYENEAEAILRIEMAGFPTLRKGQCVVIEYVRLDPPGQDGYEYRAERVAPKDG